MFYDLIYLIDDAKAVNRLHKLLLGKIGVEATIRSFTNALCALDDLAQEAPCRLGILILLDMSMPAMSGLEFLERMVRASYPLNIDVLIVTSSDRDNDKYLAFEYPQFVVGYTHKPLGTQYLREMALGK